MDLVFRLRERARIRSQITSRKSVQEGKPDRISELLLESADQIEKDETMLIKLMNAIMKYLEKEHYSCTCQQGYICGPCARDARIKPLWQALEEANNESKAKAV